MSLLVLMGAPGAGKGTQADLIAERLGYRKISTGDVLRKHIKEGTAIGKKAADIIAAGKLVPDDVLFEVLKQELGKDSKEKILLDGYPRNVSQAETLKKLANIHPVKAAVHLDVDNDELIDRLSGRRTCKKCGKSYHVKFSPATSGDKCDVCGGELMRRPDDDPAKVRVRLEVYEKETKPVLDFYRKEHLYKEVNGTGDTEQVFSELKKAINSL